MKHHSDYSIIQFNFIAMSNVNFHMPIERKSAAIMFTDIAGYTAQYLETAYNQVQENVSKMDDGEKHLNYPLPKAIVEAWERVKS